MKSAQSSLIMLGLFALCTPSLSQPFIVRTVETTRYIEHEPYHEVTSVEAILTLIAIPLAFLLADTWAKNYVTTQDNIDSYSITVKVKHYFKTIEEKTFTSSDYDDVVQDALEFAQEEQRKHYSFVFKPNITVIGRSRPYSLDSIRKPRVPSKPKRIEEYWQRLERQLMRTFVVPEPTPAPALRTRTSSVGFYNVIVTPQPCYQYTTWFY